MIVHVVPPKAEEVAAPAEAGAAAAGRRAEPEVIKKGKDEKTRTRRTRRSSACGRAERLTMKLPDEARCRFRQSRAGSTPGPGTTSASMWSICWPSGTASTGSGAGRGAGRAAGGAGGGAARQAADVHEPERPGGRRAAAVLQDRRRGPARRRRRSEPGAGTAAGAAVGIGGRAQRPEVDHRALGSEEFARLRVGVGRGEAGAISRITCWRSSSRRSGSSVAEAVGRAADAAELFVAEGMAPVMNRFNRKEDGE